MITFRHKYIELTHSEKTQKVRIALNCDDNCCTATLRKTVFSTGVNGIFAC